MKKIWLKVLSWSVTVSLVLTCFLGVPSFAGEDIKVVLDGTELTFDVPPQLINDRTMVPMRRIFEALGALVQWDEDTQTITAMKDEINVTMQIDQPVIVVSGEEITLDVAPQLVGDRTLVPIRAVAESFNAQVDWDEKAGIVSITSEENSSETTASAKPARYPEKGEMYGYGNDGIAELQYNARYLFEQTMLPRQIFADEEKIIDEITASNLDQLKKEILSIWELAAANVIINDAELSGETVDVEDEDAVWALVDERRPLYGLDEKHIANVTMEKLDEETPLVIIELLDTGWTLLSTYIGIAYHEEMGLNYFTLEKSMDFLGTGEVPYMLCQVEPDGRGSRGTIKNEKQSFIDRIKGMMHGASSESEETDGALMDEVDYTLEASILVEESTDEDVPDTVGISIYNDAGEDITSQFQFGKIKLTKDEEVIEGTMDSEESGDIVVFEFFSDWKAGDYVDLVVEVTGSDGKLVEMSAEDVKIVDIELLRDKLGPVLRDILLDQQQEAA